MLDIYGGAKVEIKGMDNLERQFGKLTSLLDDREIEDAFLAGARAMRDRMRQRIHRITGVLWSAVVAKRFKNKIKGQPAAFVAINAKKAAWAHNVEYGHGGPQPAPAHPFFRPVVDDANMNGNYIVQAVAKAIQKLIAKVEGANAYTMPGGWYQ